MKKAYTTQKSYARIDSNNPKLHFPKIKSKISTSPNILTPTKKEPTKLEPQFQHKIKIKKTQKEN